MRAQISGMRGLLHSQRRWVFALSITICFQMSRAESIARSAPPLLTNISQVKHLNSSEAQKGLPVRLRATVTFHNLHNDCFVADDQEAIFIERKKQKTVLRPGDFAEVEGITAPGDYAPVILETHVQILGRRALPEANLADFNQLSSGAEDSRLIKISGVVRSAFLVPGSHVQVQLASGGGRVRAYLYDFPAEEIPHLVDSEVMICGAVGGRFNQNRQFVAPLLFVLGAENVTLVEPAAEDPFSVPARPVSTLLQYLVKSSKGHRLKVRGVVTHQQLGEAVFLRDGGKGLEIKTLYQGQLRPGDMIEAVGFPAMGTYTPILEDAIIRPEQTQGAPSPTVARAAALLDGTHDADLVQVEANLIDSVRRGEECVLLLQDQNIILNAHILDSGGAFELPRKGSRLRVTGICKIQEVKEYVSKLTPRAFRILLRTPQDVRVLQQPPWWNARRLVWTVSVLLLAILLSLIWVGQLRRRVREQTAIIRQQVHREAALEERTRIAREFHDTLEQELVGITMQIDTALARVREAPDHAAMFLQVTRQMLRRSVDEVHRSVWDLRSTALDRGDLAAAFREAASSLIQGNSVELEVSCDSEIVLPRGVEAHLLRIGQEAVANALRHGAPTRISVGLQSSSGVLRLVIVDDGRGFDPETGNNGAMGHFGLLGMRERAEKIGGALQILSERGKGTRVELEIILDAHAKATGAA